MAYCTRYFVSLCSHSNYIWAITLIINNLINIHTPQSQWYGVASACNESQITTISPAHCNMEVRKYLRSWSPPTNIDWQLWNSNGPPWAWRHNKEVVMGIPMVCTAVGWKYTTTVLPSVQGVLTLSSIMLGEAIVAVFGCMQSYKTHPWPMDSRTTA